MVNETFYFENRIDTVLEKTPSNMQITTQAIFYATLPHINFFRFVVCIKIIKVNSQTYY